MAAGNVTREYYFRRTDHEDFVQENNNNRPFRGETLRKTIVWRGYKRTQDISGNMF
jgi:hypothetical protein